MTIDKLANMANILSQSEHYRVIRRYQKPDFYHVDDNNPKSIGVFLDIEATGLSYTNDKLIEIGMVKFEYTQDGKIFRLLDEFNAYQDPGKPISAFITRLTGITDDMAKGKKIDHEAVNTYLNGVDIIIAHNAQFDRSFFESTFPNIEAKAWGCSMHDISWNSENIESHKLEYIAYKYNFFYEGHRAIIDCLVGIHILSQTLANSKKLALQQLLENALQPRYKLWAKNAPYEHKDLFRVRKYRWDTHPLAKFKAWSIELPEHQVADEISYLKTNIYNSPINIPIDIYDAYSRFSINYLQLQTNYQSQYKDKIAWLRQLQER